ncbi:hypothetical protein B5X24_HaOG213042 [Helicoverpa armigera]|nr:hypothetical protein B5X24_HaOG213042 [Helicoverpa armigera]
MNSWIVRLTTKLFISLNKGTISGEQIAPEYIAFDLKHSWGAAPGDEKGWGQTGQIKDAGSEERIHN